MDSVPCQQAGGAISLSSARHIIEADDKSHIALVLVNYLANSRADVGHDQDTEQTTQDRTAASCAYGGLPDVEQDSGKNLAAVERGRRPGAGWRVKAALGDQRHCCVRRS